MPKVAEKVNASKVSKTNRPFCSFKEQSGALFFQPKLSIGPVDDPDSHRDEREADFMADKIMRMSDKKEMQQPFFRPRVSSLQRKCAHCEEEESNIQRKKLNSEEIPQNRGLDSYVNQLNSTGKPLSDETRNFYETRFGYDFSQVKVHTDSVAAKSAQSINALAYTSGNNIVFNQGQYSPESASGKRLLAHELTHVIQQKSAGPKESANLSMFQNPFDVAPKLKGIDLQGVIQRQTSMGPECEDLLAQIIARMFELILRATALQQNPLNLPQSGPMSIEGHQQQFVNKQVNLRRMLQQWDFNNCGTGLPQNVWHWATRPVPRPIPVTSPSSRRTLRDGSQITAEEVAVVAGGAALTIGAGYLVYRAVRFLPSLLPPLWWTIPANAAIP